MVSCRSRPFAPLLINLTKRCDDQVSPALCGTRLATIPEKRYHSTTLQAFDVGTVSGNHAGADLSLPFPETGYSPNDDSINSGLQGKESKFGYVSEINEDGLNVEPDIPHCISAEEEEVFRHAPYLKEWHHN